VRPTPPPRPPGPYLPPRPTPPRPGAPIPGRPATGRVVMVSPPRGVDIEELAATRMAQETLHGKDCSQMSEALRELSNRLLSGVMEVRESPTHDPWGRPIGEEKRRWLEAIQSPRFWNNVWSKVSDAYRFCNLGCFEDGVAVGILSGAGYCMAALGAEGLPGPGFLRQPPLPICESSIFVGCQQGYRQAANETPGCSTYTTGSFEAVFRESISQDCHLP
jgi:hypothetical protein